MEKKKPKRTYKKKSADTEPFTISLTIGDKTFTSTGETVFEALSSLKRPQKIVGKGFLSVTRGDKKREQMLLPVRLKRIFYSNPSFQIVHAKQLEMAMK